MEFFVLEINAGNLEMGIGCIIVPWVVFVTVSIFNLQKQLAVLKAELSILHEIKSYIQRQH